MVALMWEYTCYGGIVRVLFVGAAVLVAFGLLVAGFLLRHVRQQSRLSEIGLLASYIFIILSVVSCGYGCLEMYEARQRGIMRADVPVLHVMAGLYVYALCSLLLGLIASALRLLSYRSRSRTWSGFKSRQATNDGRRGDR